MSVKCTYSFGGADNGKESGMVGNMWTVLHCNVPVVTFQWVGPTESHHLTNGRARLLTILEIQFAQVYLTVLWEKSEQRCGCRTNCKCKEGSISASSPQCNVTVVR